MKNPLLNSVQSLPNFNEILPQHFEPAYAEAEKNFKKLLKEILAIENPNWVNTMTALEEANDKIEAIWGILSHLNNVKNIHAIREVYEAILPKITQFSTELYQNKAYFELFQKLKQKEKVLNLDKAQQTVIEHALRDFKLAGVDLDEDKRKKFIQLQQTLSELSNRFEKNIIDASESFSLWFSENQKEALAGIPKHLMERATTNAQKDNQDGFKFILDAPTYLGVMMYAKNRELRKHYYKAYNTRASELWEGNNLWDNSPIIHNLLKKRQELSQLVGFNNYAEYSLATKSAHNTEEVIQFLEDLVTKTKPQGIKEFKTLEEFGQKIDNLPKLEAWDIAYYSELYREQYYDISQEALRPYFTETQVLKGLFSLANKLFGLQITEVNKFASWDQHVKCYCIHDRNNHLRGYFYTDLYVREAKRSGAWMDDYLTRRKKANGQIVPPVAFLVANFSPPTNNKPGLLTHDDVITIFHEFGHTLHHVLSQVDYAAVSGTHGVPWDTVEMPSQFMENWCWEWDIIEPMAIHFETKKTLPKELFDKLVATKNFQSGLMMLRQLEFALFDFKLHLQDHNKSTQAILDAVRDQVAVVPIPSFNRFQHSFAHIFAGGYAAGYYSYKWAEVLSADAYEYFKETGLFNKSTGNKFLTYILEKGGSEDPLTLFKEFRGRLPKVDALLKHSGITT